MTYKGVLFKSINLIQESTWIEVWRRRNALDPRSLLTPHDVFRFLLRKQTTKHLVYSWQISIYLVLGPMIHQMI